MLGPINLATGPPVGDHPDLRFKYVLDGQQRIVTLCLLFAAARERFLESTEHEHVKLADTIAGILKQPSDDLEGLPAVLRVQMFQRDDTQFLESLFLSPDFEPKAFVGESQPKLWANLQLFRQLLREQEHGRIKALLQYTLQRVRLTVTVSASMATALKYFSVSAQRGKDLGPIDVLKGCMFDSAVMPEALQESYGKRWGELERLEGVGREGISYVCGLLAAIHLKPERGRRSEFEVPQMLFRELGGCGATAGPAFFDGILEPYTKLYLDMMSEEWRPRSSTGSSGSGTSGSSSGSSQEQQALKEASYLLTCLRRLSAKLDDWEALALAALMQHRLGRLSTPALADLLRELERLCWAWLLGRVPKAARRKRIAQALEELGLGGQHPAVPAAAAAGTAAAAAAAMPQHSPAQLVPATTGHAAPALRITSEERAAMLAALEGPLYTALKGRPIIALLARLNEQVHASGNLNSYMQPYNLQDSKLTVEHVLPQKPAAGSKWERLFSPEQREHWLHRLGNLVLLHGKANSRASNKDFAEKKGAYRPLVSFDTHGLPLSDKTVRCEQWDVAAVERAHSDAMRLALLAWRLHDVGEPTAAAQP